MRNWRQASKNKTMKPGFTGALACRIAWRAA